MNPRNSVRKIFGIYEHELNGWLETTLLHVNRVVDVGANDGYFTFGCAAAFMRLRKRGEIVAFEPEDREFRKLEQSLKWQPRSSIHISLMRSFAGRKTTQTTTILDAVRWNDEDSMNRTNTLVKIDVEGAEEEVLAGGVSWLNATNRFLIEVHQTEFLKTIPRLFEQRGLILDRIDQRPLFGVGREMRTPNNWWLVSRQTV